ncbi:MAG: acyl-CoA thioesterase [Vicinamibacterales bacterium]
MIADLGIRIWAFGFLHLLIRFLIPLFEFRIPHDPFQALAGFGNRDRAGRAPQRLEPLGFMLGGSVMHLIDITGAIACHRRTNALALGRRWRAQFEHPIKVGDMIVLKSRVTATFRTSLEVEVEVFSEAIVTGRRQRTSRAYLTFVSIDAAGAPRPVPPLQLETPEDEAISRAARASGRTAARARSVDASVAPAALVAVGDIRLAALEVQRDAVRLELVPHDARRPRTHEQDARRPQVEDDQGEVLVVDGIGKPQPHAGQQERVAISPRCRRRARRCAASAAR